MKDYQQAVLKMILEILNFFDENPDLLKNNPVLKNHYDQLVALTAELRDSIAKQNVDTSGFYREKLRVKKELAKLTSILTAPIRSYATDNKNEALFDAFKIPVSVIATSKDVEVEDYSGRIVGKLTELEEPLQQYNVSKDDISNLQAKLDEFSKQLLKPAQARKDKAIATANIKKLITKILTLLRDSIDNDMMTYAKSQPKIYDKYDKLREIDDSQTTHLSLYGNITDEETKEPIKNVAVTIVRFKAGHDFSNVVKLTTDTGYYRFKKLEPGEYKIIFSKKYYDTLEKEFELYPDDSIKMNEQLRKTEDWIDEEAEEEKKKEKEKKKEDEDNAEENE